MFGLAVFDDVYNVWDVETDGVCNDGNKQHAKAEYEVKNFHLGHFHKPLSHVLCQDLL